MTNPTATPREAFSEALKEFERHAMLFANAPVGTPNEAAYDAELAAARSRLQEMWEEREKELGLVDSEIRATGPGGWIIRLCKRFDRLFSLDHSPARKASEEYDEAFHDAVHALKDLRSFAAIISPTWSGARNAEIKRLQAELERLRDSVLTEEEARAVEKVVSAALAEKFYIDAIDLGKGLIKLRAMGYGPHTAHARRLSGSPREERSDV